MAALIKIVSGRSGMGSATEEAGWRMNDCERCGRVLSSFAESMMKYPCPNDPCPLGINSQEKLQAQIDKAEQEFAQLKANWGSQQW